MFKPVYWLPSNPEVAVNWERAIPEEGTLVNASLSGDSLELNISPAISVYSHHEGKRIAASIYFEIAAKYAEKVGGEIVQRAPVVGCKAPDHPQEILIARYPSLPMSFERVCAGFQSVLFHGAPTELPHHHHPEVEEDIWPHVHFVEGSSSLLYPDYLADTRT